MSPFLSIISLVVLFILVVGTIFYMVRAIYNFYMQRQVENLGLIADGKVVNRSQNYSNARPRLETEFFINYSFGVGISGVDQKIFHGSQQVAEVTYSKVGIGDHVEVIYLPQNPNLSRLVDEGMRQRQIGKKR